MGRAGPVRHGLALQSTALGMSRVGPRVLGLFGLFGMAHQASGLTPAARQGLKNNF